MLVTTRSRNTSASFLDIWRELSQLDNNNADINFAHLAHLRSNNQKEKIFDRKFNIPGEGIDYWIHLLLKCFIPFLLFIMHCTLVKFWLWTCLVGLLLRRWAKWAKLMSALLLSNWESSLHISKKLADVLRNMILQIEANECNFLLC
jgi:hypothetical protein